MPIEFPDYEEKKKKAMSRLALGIQEALKDRLTKDHGKDTGGLQANIFAKATDDGIEIEMPMHAKYLEYGTPPHMPPVEALEGWVRRKWGEGSVDGDKENRKAAWALAMHIKKYGTRPYPFIRDTFIQDFKKLLKSSLTKSFK